MTFNEYNTSNSSEYETEYRNSFFPDRKCPAADTKNNVLEERRPLQCNNWTFVDTLAEDWLWSCSHIEQIKSTTYTMSSTDN